MMIKEIDSQDLRRALDLVNDVFREFVAVEYSEQGKITFDNYLKSKFEEMTSDLKSGHKKMWGFFQEGEIIGVIATRDTSHIALMFVDKIHHRKGIARQMFHVVLDELKKNEDVTKITVNSSPYAVTAYKRLGFEKTGERQEKDGIVFVPMMYNI